MNEKYGYLSNGEKIDAPDGWEIIPEGGEIPQVHREYIESYGGVFRGWVNPKRCRGTMTAISAMVWGGVRAYARRKK